MSFCFARKGLGNEAFPDRNPQRGLCPLEENCKFLSIYADGTCQFIPLFQQVEILISTYQNKFSIAFTRASCVIALSLLKE